MDGHRREALQVIGAAIVGSAYTTQAASAQAPAETKVVGPTVAVAGVIRHDEQEQEHAGFRVKVDPEARIGWRVTFDKPLAMAPVVVVTPGRQDYSACVERVSEKGFTVTMKGLGPNAPRCSIHFIAVVV